MTIEEIKTYTPLDFEKHNGTVWANINLLSIQEIESLIGYWSCDDIDDSLQSTVMDKKEKSVAKKILAAFPTNEDRQELFDVVLRDRDITWDFFNDMVE